MKRAAFLLVLPLLAAAAAAAARENDIEVVSPDGRIVLTFSVRDFGAARACPSYRVTFAGRTVLADSRLGLQLPDGLLGRGMTVLSHRADAHDSTWKPVCGERSEIRDRYRELTVDLRQDGPPARDLQITFRAYDEGVAFRYTLPKQDGMAEGVIAGEVSEFRFTGNHVTWPTYAGQGTYTAATLAAVQPRCERPLVVRVAGDLYAALAEAALVDWARMKFAPQGGVADALVSQLDGEVRGALPLTSPWRVVMAAESPGRLLENNVIIPNLNEPCALADTSWIKPGKVIREVTLTTAGGKACVDFAAKHGLQYVEFDAGWYGHEYDAKSDARAVNVDPKRSRGPLDLPAVIAYAKERDIGVLLYVNHLAAERQLAEILPRYRDWGVRGVKYGFVNVGPQPWTSWLHLAVRAAATNRLMVDAHDEYRPTGYARTYPNFMTVEGVLGDEGTPPPRVTLTYLFTRMLAGPADHTVCYYDPRVDRAWTHAYQLAKPVCFFSPWQFLFWYDRPETSPADAPGAGGGKPRLGDDPELAFWREMPTVWDETRVLQGAIGEYAAIARRAGAQWFIGAMNAGPARTFDLPLDFLARGRAYAADLYSDDPSLPTRTKVRIERYRVDHGTVLKAALGSPGGLAVRLAPAADAKALPPYPAADR